MMDMREVRDTGRGKALLRCVAVCALMLGVNACSTIPKNPPKPITMSGPPATNGLLVTSSRAVLKKHPEGRSTFMLISQNADALRWRLALIDEAQQSIDLQVFIWSNDESGRLLLGRILDAADRGVKVRLLVDDMPKDWSDKSTAMVAQMPNIQVRRFNPGRIRTGPIGRALQMGTRFRELNRRMHNKQLIIDGQWGVIGGRNIGNPYFGLSRKYNNRDLDVLITGPVIREMERDFDEYWNAEAAYPGEAMSRELSAEKKAKALKRFRATLEKDAEILTKANLPTAPIDWSRWFATLPERMMVGTAMCLKDSPNVKGDRGVRLVHQINGLDIDLKQESCIITPYMIPSKDQLESLTRIVEEEQRRLRLLVPSMESNNHTMAHSHYKKYRKRLIDAGVELYEFRGFPSEELRAQSEAAPVTAHFISLHTKAFVLDRRWVLLGSLNVDPRSIKINTEHMMVIDSPELAARLLEDFEIMIAPGNAWHVTRDDKGKLRWSSSAGERTSQPARGFTQRISDFFFRWLPIEGQL